MMDYRELIGLIDAFTANVGFCSVKLRDWCQEGANVAVPTKSVSSCLQVQAHESLWPYQTVMIKGKRFSLIPLEFSLRLGPLVMKSVINTVRSQEESV